MKNFTIEYSITTYYRAEVQAKDEEEVQRKFDLQDIDGEVNELREDSFDLLNIEEEENN